jgi:methionyl-tRNA synthetase
MIEKYLQGRIPRPVAPSTGADRELVQSAVTTRENLERAMGEFAFHRALEALWELIGAANRYIDSTKPWEVAKGSPQDLERVLYHSWESLRIIGLLLSPFLPDTAQSVTEQLGIDLNLQETRIERAGWGRLPTAGTIRKGPPLFPRIEGGFAALQAQEAGPAVPQISVEEFQRLDLRVGEIFSAEPVPGSTKLLKLKVRLGTEERTVVAGIQGQYAVTELVGKKVAVVANLKPAKLMGVESQGMVLAAEDAEGRIVLLTPDRDLPPGSKIR